MSAKHKAKVGRDAIVNSAESNGPYVKDAEKKQQTNKSPDCSANALSDACINPVSIDNHSEAWLAMSNDGNHAMQAEDHINNNNINNNNNEGYDNVHNEGYDNNNNSNHNSGGHDMNSNENGDYNKDSHDHLVENGLNGFLENGHVTPTSLTNGRAGSFDEEQPSMRTPTPTQPPTHCGLDQPRVET